ncbi:exported hypothetical protein [Candidatus Zixiibacteriota bacterium]|nr:exported hypothetical protein [candidate division Zixibacteria bacterium]
MKITKLILVTLSFTLLLGSLVAAENAGNGNVRIGYTIIDEKGNQAINQPTFNDYEGLGLSFEKFYYNFQNGMRLNADLKNITLNNRNMILGFGKPGLFGLSLSNNQYRRIYGAEGGSFTRRSQTGTSLWYYPSKYLKLFGGGSFINLHGSTTALFYPDLPGAETKMDYRQNCYNAGFRFNEHGRMFQAEYRTADYKDKLDPARDQSRYNIRLNALLPFPKYEWVTLSGGFRHFETKYKTTDFKYSTNTVWGGALLNMTKNLALNYHFIFDRTSSDSDLIATDNLAHAVYLMLTQPGEGGITLGYQNDVNDDFANEVRANSFYAAGWYKPGAKWEFRGEFGSRAEDVKDGVRMLGNEDHTRYRLVLNYRENKTGSLELKYEGKQRKNDDIGSKVDFNRLGADGTLIMKKWADLSGGYSYSTGKYENVTQTFEFRDHILYGALSLHEYHDMTAACEATYYRSQRDLDVESYNIRVILGYRFAKNHHLEVVYNLHNFDDYLLLDNYYTANIVEINLIKELSF